MCILLYRWRIKPQHDQQFIESWTERTVFYREHYNSLGSRLHRGSDGIWYGYAQWKSAEQRDSAFQAESGKVSALRPIFQAAIQEEFPEITLEIASDYLVLPKAK